MKASIYCPFCHKHTQLSSADMTSSHYAHIENAYWIEKSGRHWWIGVCNSCQSSVLVLNNGEVIYPNPLPLHGDERIPQDIRQDLDEAKICLSVNCYRACAVMARRAMQSACINKGATKERLVDQLHELAEKGTITKDLKEWADVVRWVGNDAAHPDKQIVTKEDAEDILHLAEQFLHVIYVAPAIAKEQRTKRGK